MLTLSLLNEIQNDRTYKDISAEMFSLCFINMINKEKKKTVRDSTAGNGKIYLIIEGREVFLLSHERMLPNT